MSNQKPNRQELLEWISIVSFAVDDAKLFLDTHPCDKDALEYFEEFKKLRVQALHEYARFFGPLTLDTADPCSDYWMWIQEPWPWQEGGC